MPWPNVAAVSGIAMTAQQMNRLPIMIANATLGSDVANIDFTSIPGHFRALMLELYMRASAASLEVGIYARYNNDSGANYYHQFIYGQAASVAGGEALGGTSFQIGNATGSTAAANQFATLRHASLNYSLTTGLGVSRTGYTAWIRKYGTASGNIQIGRFWHTWWSDSVINRITIAAYAAGGNLVTGSRASLYGVP